jgi:hypothetical protein
MFVLYNQFSLLLFLLAYFNLGWLLAFYRVPWWNWLLIAVLILFLAEALASPWALIRKFILRWLSTDIQAFFAVAIWAFLCVVILSWFHIFTQVVLLVIAASLTRLNLQTAKIGDLKAFLTISILSLGSIGAGGGANWLFNHRDLVMKLVMGNR